MYIYSWLLYKEKDFYIEVKGKFDSSDRGKHLLIRKQHPDFRYTIFVYEMLIINYIKGLKQPIVVGVIDTNINGVKALYQRSG